MHIFSSLDYSIQLALVAMLSLILGSFASLVSHRLAKKQPMVFTRSKCLKCEKPLEIYNLIPLFSWIFQGGKCSKCKEKISVRYPLIELSFAVVFLVIYFFLAREISYKMLLYFAIASTLIIMVITDLEEYFIPDILQYIFAVFVLILLVMKGGNDMVFANIKSAFLYAGFGLALYAFFYFTTGLEAIGIDDIKFFFIVGLMLGTKSFLIFMLLCGIFGAVFGSIWQKIKKEETFPFAPAMCLAAFICLLIEDKFDLLNLVGKAMFFI